MLKQVSSEIKECPLYASCKQTTICHKIGKFIQHQLIICFQSAVITTAVYAVALALDRVVARKPLTHRADHHFKCASIFLWTMIFSIIYALVFYWKRILRFCATTSFSHMDKELKMTDEDKCSCGVKTSNDAMNVLTVKVEKSETNKNVTDRTVINYETTRVVKSKDANQPSTEEVDETTDDDQGEKYKPESLMSNSLMVHANNRERQVNNQSLIFHINPNSLTPVSVNPNHLPVSGYNVPLIVGQTASGGHPFPPYPAFPPTYYNNSSGGDASSTAMSHMHSFNPIDCNTNYINSYAHLTPLTAGPSAPPYP